MNTNFFKLRLAIFACLAASTLLSRTIPWQPHNFEQGKLRAAQQDKLVLLYFAADWCVPCQWMDIHTFNQPDLAAYVHQNYIPIKVDLHKVETKRLQHRFEVDIVPTLLVFDAAGRLIDRKSGSLDGSQLLAWLQQLNIPAHHIHQALSVQPSVAQAADAPVPHLGFTVPPLFTDAVTEEALTYTAPQKSLLLMTDAPLAMHDAAQLYGRSSLNYTIQLTEKVSDYATAVHTVAELERKLEQPAELSPLADGNFSITVGKFSTTGDANRFLQYLMRNNRQGIVISLPK